MSQESSTQLKDRSTAGKEAKRPRLSELSRISTHRKLLDTGMKLFLTNGFGKTTATKIADSAEVSVGTFYLHFRDKEALLGEAWTEYFREEIDHLRSIVVPQEDNRPSQVSARVRENAEMLVAWVEERPQDFLFWTGPEVAATNVRVETNRNWATWLEERIRRDVSHGMELSVGLEPAVAAQALLGICNRVLRWWLTSGCASNGESVKREAVIETLAQYHLATYKSIRE